MWKYAFLNTDLNSSYETGVLGYRIDWVEIPKAIMKISRIIIKYPRSCI